MIQRLVRVGCVRKGSEGYIYAAFKNRSDEGISWLETGSKANFGSGRALESVLRRQHFSVLHLTEQICVTSNVRVHMSYVFKQPRINDFLNVLLMENTGKEASAGKKMTKTPWEITEIKEHFES